MGQKETFLGGEADRFFGRNRGIYDGESGYSQSYSVEPTLLRMGIRPRSILEIGCSNGWRLASLRDKFPDARLAGLEPSQEAVEAGKARWGLDLRVGTADELPFHDGEFDLVIFGGCLYLCDRADLFRIAWQADRVLADTGFVCLWDYASKVPYANAYSHRDGLRSFKMDYPSMFLWNPDYWMVALDPAGGIKDSPDDRMVVALLRKQRETAWPPNPWTRSP
ncbi:MAG TPA: methyltransferase domain-containing protein [Fibrobacteria bacterium]|nr:methyltransferase domain-containing protein [Fibrobacteria bacterium]